MAKKKKVLVKMQCATCKKINYYTRKTKATEGKLELKKFCPTCRKHSPHKEGKK